jgi:hypothetical protein
VVQPSRPTITYLGKRFGWLLVGWLIGLFDDGDVVVVNWVYMLQHIIVDVSAVLHHHFRNPA